MFKSIFSTIQIFLLSLIIGLTITNSFAQIPTNGLIAYYPFNGNANDISGNALNLTPFGNPVLVYDRFERNDSAYYFDGENDYFEHPSSDLLQPTNAFTINAWINNIGIDGDQDVIVSTLDIPDLGGYQICLDYSSNTIIFTVRDPADYRATTPYLAEYLGKWIMITATYTAQTGMKLYVNSEFLAENTNPAQIVYQSQNKFRIGTNPHADNGIRRFKGEIDDVCLYNRELTQSEISDLYHQNGWPLNQGLVTHYPLDGTPDDIGINNYDGVFYGSTAPANDRNGFSNSAMNFNGIDGFMQADFNVIPAIGDFTINVWAKSNSLQDDYREIISQTSKPATPPYNFYIGKNPENKIRVGDDWGDFDPTGVDFPTDNEWHMYSVVRTESNTFLYLDGSLAATKNGTIRNSDGTEFRIARQYGPLEEYFDGVVDDIRIYNRALSVQEISDLFQENAWISCPGIPTVEYGGKIYNTVQIGNQCWLKEDLSIGTMITGSQNQINNGIIEKYCYEDNPVNCDTAGGLYQWNEAMQYSSTEGAKGICPNGWHIPTQSELTILAESVGYNSNGLKREDQGSGSGQGTNTSGFSALLNGLRRPEGIFSYLNWDSYVTGSTEYSSSDAYRISMNGEISTLLVDSYSKEAGFAVRCIKDEGYIGRAENTIIITHGFTGNGLLPIDETKWKHFRWQFAMADAVSDNRDIYLIRKGNVYAIEATYSQFAAIDSNNTIDFLINNYAVSRAINPDKDNVFIFDWTLESAVNKHGYAEAAADVLATILISLAKEYDFILNNLHFIGHSRGCVVNSETIQRLIYWASNGMLPNGVNLDTDIHMTTLDAHPAGHWAGLWGALVPMDDDRVNSFRMGIAGWKNGNFITKYIDNYFETNFYLLPPFNPFIGLDSYPGLDLAPPSNNDLSEELPNNGGAHQLVHSWYYGTIDTVRNFDEFNVGPSIPRNDWYNSDGGKTQGFYYSRNRSGNLTEIESDEGQLVEINEDHSYSPTELVFNGNFSKGDNTNAQWGTDIIPGWGFQDGITTKRGGLFNPAALIDDEHQELKHNLSYIPVGTTKITFRMRVLSPILQYTNPDDLEVYFNDILLGSFPIKSLRLNYQRQELPIQNANIGSVGNLRFKLKKNQTDVSSLLIDDVSFWHIKKIRSTVACPVDFHIYDELGNHTGPINDTTYVEEIPGCEYYVYEDSTGDKIKTVYLKPLESNNEYFFMIESRDTTSAFSYEIEDYTDSTKGTTTYRFEDIQIEPNTLATCSLNVGVQIPILNVDVDGDGNPDTTYIPNVITGIEDDNRNNSISTIPKQFSLTQNFPNPFNPNTLINYQLPVSGDVTLKVFDVLGNEVVTLVNEEQSAGRYEVVFKARGLASGIYFYQLRAGDFVQTRKMILLK